MPVAAAAKIKKKRQAPTSAAARHQGLFWWALGGLVISGALLLAASFFSWQLSGPQLASIWQRATAKLGLRLEYVLTGGRQLTDPISLTQALQVLRGQPLLSLDLNAMQERLHQLPWVASAQLQRRWPDTLIVTLVERRPAARWQEGEQMVVIDRQGQIVPTAQPAQFGKLPLLRGAGAASQAAELLEAWWQMPALQSQLREAIWVGNRRFDLVLTDGLEIKLPEGPLLPSLRDLARLITDEQLLARSLVSVDMRLPGRLVLKPAPGLANSTNPVSSLQGTTTP